MVQFLKQNAIYLRDVTLKIAYERAESYSHIHQDLIKLQSKKSILSKQVTFQTKTKNILHKCLYSNCFPRKVLVWIKYPLWLESKKYGWWQTELWEVLDRSGCVVEMSLWHNPCAMCVWEHCNLEFWSSRDITQNVYWILAFRNAHEWC